MISYLSSLVMNFAQVSSNRGGYSAHYLLGGSLDYLAKNPFVEFSGARTSLANERREHPLALRLGAGARIKRVECDEAGGMYKAPFKAYRIILDNNGGTRPRWRAATQK